MTDLFSPFETLHLRNRIVMAPMTRCACTAEGLPTPELADYYVRRAQNGVGLVIVESAAINSSDAMGYLNGCQFHSEKHVEAWRPIIDRIHEAGAKVWLQLYHAGRLTVPAIVGGKALAPSAIAPFPGESFWRPKVENQIVHFQTRTPFEVPEKMSCDQIKKTRDEFAQATRLAESAGFDGVELHGAHGYLLHSFCHTVANQRDDEYGPSPNFKFSTDVVAACRAASSITLSYRLSLHMVDLTFVRYAEDELNYPLLVKILDQSGIDVFHCSELEAGADMMGEKRSLTALVASLTDKPVISCGRLANAEKANRVLQNGADLVAFGRSLIANPELVKSLRSPAEYPVAAFHYDTHFAKVY
jgi:2,4-dienoyl-CoA reductase-like NADH-dependent reductase (Old Yellow Enzyme family)